MNTSEILDLAADKIQDQGWARGGNGWFMHDGEPIPGGLCLEGGIQAAMGLSTHGEDLTSCPAYQAVKEYLGDRLVQVLAPHLPARDLWQFNDAGGRTAEEVIEVLRAAAAVERAKEESLEGSNLREKESVR